MFFKPHHLVRRLARLASVGAIIDPLRAARPSSAPPRSQVRIINASPDAPAPRHLPGHQRSRLQSRLRHHHLLHSPRSRHLHHQRRTPPEPSRSSPPPRPTFAPSTQYTVLIGNSAASLQQLTLTDQSQPAPSGQIALRFIDQATRISAVDIYLVPAGQKLTAVTPLVTGSPSAPIPATSTFPPAPTPSSCCPPEPFPSAPPSLPTPDPRSPTPPALPAPSSSSTSTRHNARPPGHHRR